MGLQELILSIDDPGIGRAIDANVIPIMVGTATNGSITAIKSFGRPTDLLDEYVAGPLAVAGAHVLRNGGRPIRALRIAATIIAVETAVNQTGSGTVMVVGAATANDDYAVKVIVTKAGGPSVARVKYTLDDFDSEQFPATFTEEITLDGSGDVVLVGTGMTVNFAAAALIVDTEYVFTTTAPHYAASDITAAFLLVDPFVLDWRFVTFVGDAPDIAGALLDLAAIKAGIENLFANNKYVLAMASVSRDTPANIIAAYNFESIDVAAMFGRDYVLASAPINGRAVSSVSKPVIAAARAARSLISTDLSRSASGAIESVVGINHDEFQLLSGLNDLRIGTSRTWVEQAGFYFSDIFMASNISSDFKYWQHALVMRIACQTVFNRVFKYLSASLRTAAGGVLDKTDAADIDADVNKGLADALLRPLNAEGSRGHASEASFMIDDDVDILTSEELTGELQIQPLAYPKTIRIRLGFKRIL